MAAKKPIGKPIMLKASRRAMNTKVLDSVGMDGCTWARPTAARAQKTVPSIPPRRFRSQNPRWAEVTRSSR